MQPLLNVRAEPSNSWQNGMGGVVINRSYTVHRLDIPQPWEPFLSCTCKIRRTINSDLGSCLTHPVPLLHHPKIIPHPNTVKHLGTVSNPPIPKKSLRIQCQSQQVKNEAPTEALITSGTTHLPPVLASDSCFLPPQFRSCRQRTVYRLGGRVV